MLRLPPAFLDHIEVHQHDAARGWRVERRGDRLAGPVPAWPTTPRVTLLEPVLDAAGMPAVQTVYLRLQTTSASLIHVQVLSEDEADRRDALEAAAIWIYAGVVLTLAAWAGLTVHRAERPLAAWFVAYQATGAITVVTLTGEIVALGSRLGEARHVIGSLAVIASAIAGAGFCRLLLAPERAAWLQRFPIVAMAVLAACALAFIGDAQRLALQSTQWVVAAIGVWCWWMAATRVRTESAPVAPAGIAGVAQRDEPLIRLAFVLIGASGLLTAGRHLGGWTIGGAGTYGAPLNYGITALVMFTLLIVRDRRNRAADRELRRRLATERARARERSEQLEDKTQLLAMLEHELKSPLTVLQFALADQQSSQTELARSAVRDMVEVVERTVQIDRMDNGAWVPGVAERVQLAPWLLEVRRAQRAPAQPRADIEYAVPPQLEIRTDELLLRLIVGNLLDNACRYGNPSQPVRVEAGTTAAGTQLVLRVSNGAGSSDRPDPQRVFERYYRAPRAQRLRGTGLGLWLSRALARRLGGDLKLLPGTSIVTFELCLPLQPPTDTAPPLTRA